MTLVDEPGQDVKKFGNKMAKMDRRISGIGSDPIYLSTLVATAFINCKVLALQLKDTGLHDLVDSNTKNLSVDNITRTLKTKFWYLKAQGLWIPD